MRKYHSLPAFVILIVGLILWIFNLVPNFVLVAVFIVAIALFSFSMIGTLFFLKGVRIIKMQKTEDYKKASDSFEKALRAGIPANYAVIAASTLLQNGRTEIAKDSLERLVKDSNKKIATEAKVCLSMYYWSTGDLGAAIRLCEEARKDGYRGTGLYVNLCTYYLKRGDLGKFKKTVKEAVDLKIADPALVDYRAVCDMISGNWGSALTLLTRLLSDTIPNFSDPFVHLAMVHIHYGEVEKAVKTLDSALSVRFTTTPIYPMKEIEGLRDALKSDGYSRNAVELVNASTLNMVNGIFPKWKDDPKGKYAKVLSGFPPEPKDARIEEIEEEPDGDEPNTEITEADERWIKNHSAE